MSLTTLPLPEGVPNLLIWHQGALGDLLLAGPALLALRRRYPQARLVGLGHPERWRLLSRTLSLDEVWDSGESRWAGLFANGPLSPELQARLASFQLALVFSPDPASPLPGRLQEAGIPAVGRVPSFQKNGCESVAAMQAKHLAALGLSATPRDFRLILPAGHEEAEAAVLAGREAWLAVAPGSGHPAKNWPLSHYYEVSRALSWEYRLKVLWLAGPAEADRRPYLQALAAAQDQVLLAGASLAQVAATLAHCRLFIGNDSGLTHLAAVLDGPEVLALFGPTDPRVWAPPGHRVRILTAPCPLAPCARGREIPCPRPQCLEDLAPTEVLQAARKVLAGTLGGG